jgi:dTDP-4-amino-4,6-dideoxygalactose transaminase
MSEWRIPLSDLDYGAEEEAAVLRVLRSKWLSMGPEVSAFEREFAVCLGVRHAFAVANGTAALHLALLALDVGQGDEVVQPAINFVASANMTAAVGATPVFADIIGLEEPTIDPREVERLLTRRTKAVVVMHYGGYLSRMGELTALCRDRKIALIEDACHAVGAWCPDPTSPTVHRRMAGSLGDISCFSFFSNKNLATGEGGMLITDRERVAASVRLLRSHGMTTLTWDRHRGHAASYDVVSHGYNYRFDELRAALGRVQLEKLNRNNERRRQLVRIYQKLLASSTKWGVPFIGREEASACHLMVVVAADPAQRHVGAQALRENGIQTSLHYPCIPRFKAFGTQPDEVCPRSAAFADRILTLPLYPTLGASEVEEICTILCRASN